MNRGGNAGLIVYEECGFVKGEDFTYGVDSVLGPQLLRSNGREIFISSPSEDPDHPLHTVIKPECEELGTFFSYTVFDSPSIPRTAIVAAARRSGCKLTAEMEGMILDGLVNSANVLEIAARTNSKLSDAFKREYLAMIIRPSTLMVVPDYGEHHVFAFDVLSDMKWTVSIDWGGTRDKTVALLHGYEFMTNTDLILEEMVFPPNTATSKIVDELRRWDRDYKIEEHWADVHGQTQVDLIDTHNYPVTIPQKSDWLATVQTMSVKFTLNQIFIHPSCQFLRRSLRAGMFNKNRTDFERSEDLGHCDALAALMYAVRSQDRTSPYVNRPSPNMVTLHREDAEEIKLAAAMNVHGFGKFKHDEGIPRNTRRFK
jgi:hypothetical protein